MKVIDALRKKKTLSFEFFPPKTKEQEEKLFAVIAQLKSLDPDYVSVTYGALGTDRERSFFWVNEIKQRFSIEPVAHLTCMAASQDDIKRQIDELVRMGVLNILALRGDSPEGEKFSPPAGGFHFAKELVSYIKQNYPQICLGVAGYPEGHTKSLSLDKEILFLKEKVEAGADYVITQLFFENLYYFNFVDRCRKAGIRVPIIPGIMPITSYKLLRKMTQICGATIPGKLLNELEEKKEKVGETKKMGVEQAIKQCKELYKADIPGLHFFVMNQAGPISQVLKELDA